jgi:hypothetical protein
MIRLPATVRVLSHPVQDSSVLSSFASGMPHGGFKRSGYGKDLSMYGFEDFPRDKYVLGYLGEQHCGQPRRKARAACHSLVGSGDGASRKECR